MFDYRRIQEKRKAEACYKHWHYPEVLVGGVPHCGNCGAVVGSIQHLYKIWRRCRENLGLVKKGHDYGR